MDNWVLIGARIGGNAGICATCCIVGVRDGYLALWAGTGLHFIHVEGSGCIGEKYMALLDVWRFFFLCCTGFECVGYV